jgi:pyruvate dehydrogenase E2 component (dihydrolipoamide acetyltransferase)
MISEVRMPKLGMAMKRGVVTRWKAAEGEEVCQGADLLDIETEKVSATIPAPASGVLGRIVAAPGTQLPVGGLLALIGEAGDTFPPREELAVQAGGPGAQPSPAGPAKPAAARPALTETGTAEAGTAEAGTAEPAGAGQRGGGGAPVSPAARRRARELGIDVTLVPPAAPGKRVTSDDVDAYAAARAAASSTAASAVVQDTAPSPAAPAPPRAEPLAPPGAARVIPLAGIRAVAAERLTESLREMAQVTVSREADVSGLVRRRAELAPGFEAATGVRLTYTDLLIEAAAALLPAHPLLNATLTERGIEVSEAVHMGVAVALDDGLIVPVIRDAGTRTLGGIAQARAELAARARSGTLGLGDVEGGTFTISNLGSYGADAFTPIVNPPQCAILGTGRITEKPVVAGGEICVRPMMWLSLTFDHRIADGAPAARFLTTLAEALGEAPGPAGPAGPAGFTGSGPDRAPGPPEHPGHPGHGLGHHPEHGPEPPGHAPVRPGHAPGSRPG